MFGKGRTALRIGYSVNYVNDEVMFTADNAVSANDGLQSLVVEPDLFTIVSGPLPSFDPPDFRVPGPRGIISCWILSRRSSR